SPGSSTLTLSAGTAAAGTSTLTITATGGSISRTITISYSISAPPPPPPPPPPSGAIVFRSVSTSSYPSGSTSVITVAIPAGAVPGDLLVASVGFGNSSAVTVPSISTPAGWTL